MKIKWIVLCLFLIFVSACAVRSIAPGDTMEVNMDFDLTAVSMRHGWTFLSGPEITHVGTNDKEAIQRGEKLFTQHCQQCHGPKGIGDGPLAEKLKIKPANLQNISGEITNTYLVVQINNGKGDMPQWQDYLTTKETHDLTSFVRTLKENK